MTIAEGSIQDRRRDVLVLGIGNILWADEGFGSRAAEMFNQRYADIEGVECADGGTLGFYLINLITSSRRILVFDCCDFREKPGTMKVLRKDDIVIWLSTKISPHQTGLSDLLAQAEILGKAPEEIVVIGVQPQELNDYGGGLTPTVHACLGPAMKMAEEELAKWGYQLKRRAPGEKVQPLMDRSVEETPYVSGRPSSEEACRDGDERFMVRQAGTRTEDPNNEF